MGDLIEQKAGKVQMLAGLTKELSGFVSATGWWPKFCDGTLAGFKVDEDLIPKRNPMTAMVFSQVAKLLNEFGEWKSARPDPNELVIPLR
jgi:hypothetical protein